MTLFLKAMNEYANKLNSNLDGMMIIGNSFGSGYENGLRLVQNINGGMVECFAQNYNGQKTTGEALNMSLYTISEALENNKKIIALVGANLTKVVPIEQDIS